MDPVTYLQMLDDRTHGVCPACGEDGQGWSSDVVRYTLQPLDEVPDAPWEPRPLYAFMCSNCGFVRLHNPFPIERDASG